MYYIYIYILNRIVWFFNERSYYEWDFLCQYNCRFDRKTLLQIFLFRYQNLNTFNRTKREKKKMGTKGNTQQILFTRKRNLLYILYTWIKLVLLCILVTRSEKGWCVRVTKTKNWFQFFSAFAFNPWIWTNF